MIFLTICNTQVTNKAIGTCISSHNHSTFKNIQYRGEKSTTSEFKVGIFFTTIAVSKRGSPKFTFKLPYNGGQMLR